MQIIRQGWENTLIDLVKGAHDKIYLSSPFITKHTAQLIINNKNDNVDCKLLTKFTMPNMCAGGLDLDAVKAFKNNNFTLKNIENLHAKIFIFDNKAMITSANLTHGGLYRNLEYGVLLENKQEIEGDFLSYYNNKDFNYIEMAHILKVASFLKCMPKKKKHITIDENLQIFSKDLELDGNLSAGNKRVFDGIEALGLTEFHTKDIYKIKDEFLGETPENTIRRNLQELRDVGLLAFVDKGVYRKLWK